MIKDFAYDGLHLSWLSQHAMPESLAVNDRLTITFTTDLLSDTSLANHLETNAQANSQFSLEVKVAQVNEDGLDVLIFNQALDALTEISIKQQSEETSSPHQHLTQSNLNIFDSVKTCFTMKMSTMLDKFLPVAHDALFVQADQSSSNTELMCQHFSGQFSKYFFGCFK
ncbi:hypothetical protein [sulfur-oxidizing endosymbiont of Gigantopelta aegis]|uniref:hypothetical protein n=1 Tax=sulfur-oxidizing endosymbiont of Gigantopelta aegis TaxID=2794934 RepID=UPI0018DBE121|nr:hypothetical protein [sulfur-oxidizing endosymbiont of Gigantopelta aegis]